MEREFMEKVLNKLDVLSSDVNEMKSDINELKNDMNGQKAFSIRVLENFDKVFAKLDEHDKLIKANTKEIGKIKDFLIVKEDELFNKIRALFDGYNSNYEKETDLEVRQKDTEQKVGINSLRISMLEETSKHHTEQISNLLAK